MTLIVKSGKLCTYQVLGNNKSNFTSQILIDGKLESKPIKMAEGMNHFFLNKIEKIKNSSAFAISLISMDKLHEKLLKTLKGKKSTGMDWICGYSLKLVASVLSGSKSDSKN